MLNQMYQLRQTLLIVYFTTTSEGLNESEESIIYLELSSVHAPA